MDGVFSYASKANPTEEGIDWYQKFIEAAVHSHASIKYKIAPTVHLMRKHVAKQMRDIPGGLGKKERTGWNAYTKSHS